MLDNEEGEEIVFNFIEPRDESDEENEDQDDGDPNLRLENPNFARFEKVKLVALKRAV